MNDTQKTFDIKTDWLDTTPFGKLLAWKEIEELANLLVKSSYKSGQIIFKEGDPGDFLGLVYKGKLQVQRTSEHGIVILGTLNETRSFGEMSMLDHQRRSASVVALESTELYILGREAFRTMEKDHPRLWGNVIKYIAVLLSQRLRSTSSRLVDSLDEA